MLINWSDFSTSEIINKLQDMQFEHENVKKVLLKLWESMEEIEKNYENGNIELKKRNP